MIRDAQHNEWRNVLRRVHLRICDAREPSGTGAGLSAWTPSRGANIVELSYAPNAQNSNSDAWIEIKRSVSSDNVTSKKSQDSH